MSMSKKVKQKIVYVHCKNCKNASYFGDNSCFCKEKKLRVCACNRYGRMCNDFKKKL